jgi:hypothetical protein
MRTFEKYSNLKLLWLFPIIVPLGTILLSFYLQEWYWGLMDDAAILGSGNNFAERLSYLNTYNGTAGMFRPTFALHSVVFYTLFEDSPVLMHVLKWIEAILTLLLWGLAVHRISGSANTLPKFCCIALSFHYFYDSFFFISTHDVLGLLFMGGALNLYLAALDSPKPVNSVLQSLLGVLLMFIGFGAKEPLVTCGAAFGLSFLALAQMEAQVRARALYLGSSLLVISILYGLTIKLVVQGGYTSSYSFTNYSRMLGNFWGWVNKNLLNHSPWLVIVFVLGLAAAKTPASRKLFFQFGLRQRWGMLLGLLLYGGYLLFLLPWNTTAYYAGPLGVFFSIPVVIFVAQILPQTSIALQVFTPVAALLFNMLVSQWALTRESLYHHDTQNLMAWIQGNPAFQAAARSELVYCNAMEGGGAIPAHLGRDFGVSMSGFKYQGLDQNRIRSGEIMVYTPRFGSSTDIFAPDVWDTMFYSKFWQVYVHK